MTTVGAILFLQNVPGRFETWSYTWALVLASVGAGIFLHAALKDDAEEERLGLRLVIFSLTMFVIFGFFFEFVIFSRSSESASDSFLVAYAFDSGWGFLPESVGTIILESG